MNHQLTTIPMLVRRDQSIAFHVFDALQFQKLCRDLFVHEPYITTCNEYGLPGQLQRGIDLLAYRESDKGIEVGQCKRYEVFTSKDIREASEEFLAHWDYWQQQRVQRFILFVSTNIENTRLQDEILKQKARFREVGVNYEAWSSVTLRAKLQSHPDIVRTYFDNSDTWINMICLPTHKSRESSAARDVPPIISNILRALNHPDQKKRVRTFAELEKLEDPHLPEVLIELLEHPAADVRLGAALQLANRFNDPRALPTLKANLDSTQGDNDSNSSLIRAIGRIGSLESIPTLIPFVLDSGPIGRLAQDSILELMGEAETVDGEIALQLLQYFAALPTSHIAGRVAIIEFLRRLWILGEHETTTLKILHKQLDKSQSNSIRRTTLETLRVVGSSLSISTLLAILRDTSDDLEFRQSVAMTLGYLGENAPIRELVQILKEEKNPSLRNALLICLAITRQSVLEPSFERLLRNKDADLVALGIWGLALLESTRAVKTIATFLESERHTATVAIGPHGSVYSIDEESFWVDQDSTSLHKFAVHALKQINTPEANEFLSKLQPKQLRI